MFQIARANNPFAGLALLCGLVTHTSTSQGTLPQERGLLGAVSVEVTVVEDSSGYQIYRYRIMNPGSSRGGVSSVDVDVSAPRGTGQSRLPFSGRVAHGAGGHKDHVPLGAIAPEPWSSQILYNAALNWHAPAGVAAVNDSGTPSSIDSVSPGSSKDGFGLRSPYLLGIRTFTAEPTYQSCCSKPIPNTEEHEFPNPGSFRVHGLTVAPRTRPQDMNLGLLVADLRQVCGTLHWITDSSTCAKLQGGLETATQASRHGDRKSIATNLQLFLQTLESARAAVPKAANDNAYWLLRSNTNYLLAHN